MENTGQEPHSLAELRHALRTPLNHILGYSEMLLEDAESAGRTETTEALGAITGAAQVILELIHVHLPLGSTIAQRQNLDQLRADISKPLQNIMQALGRLAKVSEGRSIEDILRISSAAADLLSFTHGQELPVVAAVLPAVDLTDPVEETRKAVSLLVVDDNEANRDILCRQLERQGYTAEAVEDGPQALSRMGRRRYDLVLLDIMMPGMDGVEVLRRMKQTPELQDTPVVMISVLDELASAAYCIEQGAEDYLLKPFQPVLMRARLNVTLEQNRLRKLERERTLELERIGVQLRRSNEDLQRFAYAASHDLQAPLRTVVSYVQLLARKLAGKLTSDENELVGFIVSGTKRMSDLIHDLLVYSQVSTSDRQPEPVACDAIVNEVREDLQSIIEQSQAVVTCKALPVIAADRVQIRQLFHNLIGNGIKYRAKLPPEISITAVWEPGQWHFQVRDNGEGIDPKFRHQIFEMFQRLHGEERPGTGIGLAICKRVVERLQGEIWVESERGFGSTFHFTIPQASERTEGTAA